MGSHKITLRITHADRVAGATNGHGDQSLGIPPDEPVGDASGPPATWPAARSVGIHRPITIRVSNAIVRRSTSASPAPRRGCISLFIPGFRKNGEPPRFLRRQRWDNMRGVVAGRVVQWPSLGKLRFTQCDPAVKAFPIDGGCARRAERDANRKAYQALVASVINNDIFRPTAGSIFDCLNTGQLSENSAMSAELSRQECTGKPRTRPFRRNCRTRPFVRNSLTPHSSTQSPPRSMSAFPI